jgi:DNA polymerase-1
VEEPDLVEAVRSRPEADRWVWRSTAGIYPRLLAAGVRVERCYDIEDAELLLLGHEGRLGEPRSAAAAWARLRNAPVPPDPPARAAEPGSQSSLFEPQPVAVPLEALLEVYADQQRRHLAAEHPGRMRLLTAAESAGMLVAAEMNRAGLPWRADVHRAVLHELLGERYAGGGEPRRLAELADEVSAAFGRRVRPDLPADVVRAFAQAGIKLRSTRRWELEEIDHPAVKPLIEYKKLYRIWTAHGWGWLQDWVRDAVPARGQRLRPLDDQRWRGTSDTEGDPAGRRRGRRLASRGRRRRPDGAAGARRDLAGPRPDGGRRARWRPLHGAVRPGVLR